MIVSENQEKGKTIKRKKQRGWVTLEYFLTSLLFNLRIRMLFDNFKVIRGPFTKYYLYVKGQS